MHVDGEACVCTSGFPERDRLVSNVFSRSGPATRLIPEMSFTCDGTIVGFTAAVNQQNGEQDPMIQVWSENSSQPGVYYKTTADIAIDGAVCVDGLTEVSSRVFHCNLNESARVSVQPGDILGLELPPVNDDDVILSFANVTRGPTNYVFEQQPLSSPVVLSQNSNSVNQDLPQISLEVEPGTSS